MRKGWTLSKPLRTDLRFLRKPQGREILCGIRHQKIPSFAGLGIGWAAVVKFADPRRYRIRTYESASFRVQPIASVCLGTDGEKRSAIFQ